MSIIKFRQWDGFLRKMNYFEIRNGNKPNKFCENNFILNSFDTMIYTYKEDINEKDIYESDIVRVKYQPILGKHKEFHAIVEFDDRNGDLEMMFPHQGCSLYFGNDDIEEIKVIGNIYENPELFNFDESELLIKDDE